MTGGSATKRVTIDGAGRMGVGTSVAPHQKLTITGVSGAANGNLSNGILALTTGTGVIADTRLLMGIVDDDYAWLQAADYGVAYRDIVLNPNGGNTGVGVTAPFAPLHVKETGWSSGSPYGTVQLIEGQAVHDNNWSHLVITDADDSDGNGGSISFATGEASALNPFASIKGYREGSNYGALDFYTRPSGGTATQRLRIDSSGYARFTLSANAVGTFQDNVGEVTDGTFCLQVANSAQDALKPLGFRAEDIRFSTGSLERMRVASDGVVHLNGDVKVLSGDIQMGNGRGINFSASSNAGGMASETLDDYEEGSWTPTVFNTAGSLTVSYNFQYGHYTKIGNLVQLYGSIRLNSASGGSGRAMVKGLPFTPDTALYACVGITHYNTALPGGGGADYKSNMIYDNGINFEVNSADQDTGEAIGSWEAGYIGFSITYRTSQ